METAPQEIVVQSAPHWMERPIEVAVIEHLDAQHSNSTKVFLTRESALRLLYSLTTYLDETKED